MSFQTVYLDVNLNKAQLLSLFLGQGNLEIRLPGLKKIILNGISDRYILRQVGSVEYHDVKIRGTSEDPNISYVDGRATLETIEYNYTFTLSLELHLQDQFE